VATDVHTDVRVVGDRPILEGHAGDGHDRWHEHDHVPGLHHHFDDMKQQRETTSLGMWAFLATEVMMFGGLFFTYSLYRWMYHNAYIIGSRHLNITLGTINTFVLLFSSLTMALAVHAAQEGKRKKLVLFLIVTMILGAAFLGIKAIEWGTDYREGLVPGLAWFYFQENARAAAQVAAAGITPNHVMMYFVIYFCMTGLHALHMVIGLTIVGITTWMSSRGAFENGNEQPVEIVGLYWHLIDIVWVFLFPLLYLIGGFHPGGLGGGH
jgi:cytochrome c oxidase subunit III